MPDKPQWLMCVPGIAAELEELRVPVVDRALVERLFRLRRRRAIELMHRFGGYKSGRTFLLDRQDLLDKLRAIEGGAEFRDEQQRRQRISAALDRARKDRAAAEVTIIVKPEISRRRLEGLSNGIHLGPGALNIEFRRAEELLEKLYELSQAIINDYEQFQALVEPDHPAAPSLTI